MTEDTNGIHVGLCKRIGRSWNYTPQTLVAPSPVSTNGITIRGARFYQLNIIRLDLESRRAREVDITVSGKLGDISYHECVLRVGGYELFPGL